MNGLAKKKLRCLWNKRNIVWSLLIPSVISALGFGLFHYSKSFSSGGPNLTFYDWVWPHQTTDLEYLSVFDICGRQATKCLMMGPRFLVGTFEINGLYVSHISAKDNFNNEMPIGLVWRIEQLISPHLAAREIRAVLDFFSDLGISVEVLVIDYDSPSRGLADYADWIKDLSAQRLQRPISTTGLASWSLDNPVGFESLLDAADTVSIQLYQGSKTVFLNDALVHLMESSDNLHISLYCADKGLLDHVINNVSISRPLNIGIFDGVDCN